MSNLSQLLAQSYKGLNIALGIVSVGRKSGEQNWYTSTSNDLNDNVEKRKGETCFFFFPFYFWLVLWNRRQKCDFLMSSSIELH